MHGGSPVIWRTLASYEFTTADTTAPQLVSAVARDALTVRATFDEAMCIEGAASALLAAHWEIDRENVSPDVGASLEVIAVASVVDDPCSFDLTVQWEQTPGCPYRVRAAGLADVSGNPVDSAHADAAWTGWAETPPVGRHFSLWDLMPATDRTLDASQDLRRLTNIWQEVVDRLLRNCDHWLDQFDPDLCSDDDVAVLLYELGNPFVWDELALTAAQRRQLITDLVPIYKLKGTAPGIEGVCRTLLGLEVRVVDYISDTWCLGFAMLGDGDVAEVMAEIAGPYDLSSASWPIPLTARLDDGAEQTLELAFSDVLDSAAVTAAEIATALGPQVEGGGARTLAAGTAAVLTSGIGPFAIPVGSVLRLAVCGAAYECVFGASDMVNPLSASSSEMVAAILRQIPGLAGAPVTGGTFRLATAQRGSAATIAVIAGTAEAALGLSGTVAGADGENPAIYSATIGTTAAVQVTGGALAEALGIPADRQAGVGGCVLGPSDSYSLYCFDIETAAVLSSAQEALVRRIAVYMKRAEEHLVNIRPAPQREFADAWVLGLTALGDGTILAE